MEALHGGSPPDKQQYYTFPDVKTNKTSRVSIPGSNRLNRFEPFLFLVDAISMYLNRILNNLNIIKTELNRLDYDFDNFNPIQSIYIMNRTTI